MSANFEAKKVVVEEIINKIKDAKSVVLVDYNKLTVAEVSELRNKCRQANCEYKVYKNTLVRKAFNDLGFKDFDADLNGPTAVAFGADETCAAKLMTEAAKTYDGKIVVKSAFVDNSTLTRQAQKHSLPCLRGKSWLQRCSARCRCPLQTSQACSTICCPVS